MWNLSVFLDQCHYEPTEKSESVLEVFIVVYIWGKKTEVNAEQECWTALIFAVGSHSGKKKKSLNTWE